MYKDIKLIFCHAGWCGQCKAFTPVVKEVVEETGVQYVDADPDKDMAVFDAEGIQNLPVVLIIKGDNKVRIDGIVSKERLLEEIKNLA